MERLVLCRWYSSISDCLLSNGLHNTLQQDVDSICAWVDQNLLLLNTLKCCYLLFSRKPTPTSFIPVWQWLSCTMLNSLNISGSPSPLIQLCLHTSTLFPWKLGGSLHGMLYHKLYCYADTSSLLIIYLTTMQPHLEYASSVWDLYLKKNILNVANIPTLASRRQQLKSLSVI